MNLGDVIAHALLPGAAILVWHFRDAPVELQNLSTHGGDEDWLAVLPPGEVQPFWMESGTPFGCCDVTSQEIEFGITICIGAHS